MVMPSQAEVRGLSPEQVRRLKAKLNPELLTCRRCGVPVEGQTTHCFECRPRPPLVDWQFDPERWDVPGG